MNPVLQLRSGPDGLKDFKVGELANAAIAKLGAYFDGVDPEFWRDYEGGKVRVTRELQKVVERSFGPVETEVSRLLQKTEEQTKAVRTTLEVNQRKLEETTKVGAQLEGRLSSLESPLGRIPLGLTDLITLFPVLIATLVVMTTAALEKSSRLYLALWREYRKKQDNSDAGAFRHYADCWHLPPYRGLAHAIMLPVCALLAASIFIRTTMLILREPDLFAALGSGAAFQYGWFLFLYLISGLVIAGCVAWLRHAFRQLSQVTD